MKNATKQQDGRLASATYTRISHEFQSQYSLPSQQQACEALAASKGYQTSPEFAFVDDGGLSTELDRPALSAMREAVRAGLVRAVIVHSIDRLSRKLVHQLLLLEEFEKHGAEVLFVDAPADNTPEGRMLLTMKGMFGQYERERIRERTVRGSRQRAKEGKVNQRAPYGYVSNKDGFLVPHLERAAIVRRIFLDIIAGQTCGEIAESLNRDGVPAPGGATWVRAVVLQISRTGARTGANCCGASGRWRNPSGGARTNRHAPARTSAPARGASRSRHGFASAFRPSSTRPRSTTYSKL